MLDLVMKEGDLFLVAGPSGDIIGSDGPHGLYYKDTRYLSRLTLRLGGEQPHRLSASAAENYQMRIFYQARAGQQERPGTIGVERRRVVESGVLYEQVRVTNYSLHAAEIEVEVGFDADFRDLFEARGAVRPARGTPLEPEVRDGTILLGYVGLDHVRRRTLIVPQPAADVLTANASRWVLTLEPGASRTVALAVVPEQENGFPAISDFDAALARLRESYRAWDAETVSIETDDLLVNRTLQRSRFDLRALLTDLGHGPFPVAGIPWFCVPFGRDSLITALQALPFNPSLAVGTLRTLAALQGQDVNPDRLEEPGKIVHEVRSGEMALLGEVPFLRYYGTVDATPLFLVLLGETYRWTGDLDLAAALLPNIRAALHWIRTYGDKDGDGLVEYAAHEGGLTVQSWKDSSDSISHRSGDQAESPIAVSEVQGYVYDAYVKIAPVLRALAAAGHGEDLTALADELEAEARKLQDRFDQAFWMEDRQYYAIALDGQKQQVGTVSSDPGHCLWSGIVPEHRRASVAQALMGESLFSGWGVRTLAVGENTYNPMSYHNGSVWPHDNALIALGLKRAGFDAEAARLTEALFAVASRFPLHRLPELFCGYPSEEGEPVEYPASCSPQAWAAGTPFMLMQAVLGMEADAPGRTLRLRPYLPVGWNRVSLRGVRVGEAVVDLEVTREGVTANVRKGELTVQVE